jgi:MATE family, multidrug efflux pump
LSDQPTDRELAWRVWSMAWPTVLHSMLESSMGVVDLLMVRPLGPDATAAVGIGRQVAFLMAAAAIAISVGVITLVSQSVGAGDRRRVQQIVWQSLALVVLLGLATGAAGFALVRPLLIAMRSSQETIAAGTGYLQVYFVGIVFLWGSFVLAAVFRGAGDAQTPLRLGVVTNVLNVGLNYILIFGLGPIPALGVMGAALGTVLARGGGVAIYLFFLLPRASWLGSEGLGRPVWMAGTAWQVLRVGAPLAVAAMLRNSSRLVFLAIVGGGSLALAVQAAVGVGMQIRLIGILPALAFQTATAALVGEAIGRGATGEAQRLAVQSVRLMTVLMGVSTLLLLVAAEPVAWLFVAEGDLTRLTSTVIRWFAVAQFFSALAICTQGALNGGGDTGPAARYSLVSQWGLMLPLAAGLVALGWNPQGALLAWVLAPVLTLGLTWRRFRLGIWKRGGV